MPVILIVMNDLRDERKSSFCFFYFRRGFLSEKAPFPPPLALLGYVPIPTSCSYYPQTPITPIDLKSKKIVATYFDKINKSYPLTSLLINVIVNNKEVG